MSADYNASRIDDALIAFGLERLAKFWPDADTVVLTDQANAMAAFGGRAVVVYEDAAQIARAIDAHDPHCEHRIFFLAFDSDENALATVRAIKARGARWFPIKKGVIAKYWHLHNRVRDVLRTELAEQEAAGFAKWDDDDFANLLQAIDITREVPGAFVEVGAFRGSSGSVALRYMNELGLARDCYFLDVFHGFDYEAASTSADAAWAGTHETEGRAAIAARLERHAAPERGLNVTVLQSNVITDPWPDNAAPIALANIDVDLYEAVLAALEQVAPRLAPGGIAVIEDPGHTPHLIGARLALEEFMESDAGRRFWRIHMASGQTWLFRKDAAAITVDETTPVARTASAARDAAAVGPNHALVCGAIRNPEELRYILQTLVAWRSEGRLDGITISTWYGELEREPALARDIAAAGIDVVVGREVMAGGLRNIWRQQRALEQGLDALPANARVLKLRTDKCARRLARFRDALARPLPWIDEGSTSALGCVDRIVLSRASATIPGLIDDTTFFGHRDDLRRLVTYDATPEAKWCPSDAWCGNLLWVAQPLARAMPVLASLYENFDPARVSRAAMRHVRTRPWNALPQGLRRAYGAWWRFLDREARLAIDDRVTTDRPVETMFGVLRGEARTEIHDRGAMHQVILEGEGLAAATLRHAANEFPSDSSLMTHDEIAEMHAFLAAESAEPLAPAPVVPTTQSDAATQSFPASLLEPEAASAPWAPIVERTIREGLESDRPLAQLLWHLVDELERADHRDQAEVFLLRAASMKHPDAILAHGRNLIESGSPREGLERLMWNVQKRHAPTLRWLADEFRNGTRLPHDPARAERLLAMAEG